MPIFANLPYAENSETNKPKILCVIDLDWEGINKGKDEILKLNKENIDIIMTAENLDLEEKLRTGDVEFNKSNRLRMEEVLKNPDLEKSLKERLNAFLEE
jgi:hypothetical protein